MIPILTIIFSKGLTPPTNIFLRGINYTPCVFIPLDRFDRSDLGHYECFERKSLNMMTVWSLFYLGPTLDSYYCANMELVF